MKLGDFDIQVASDGPFGLDGGSVFGIVPKTLWSKLVPCDELNRVTLTTDCMLVRTRTGLVLVECGMGRKYNAKLRDIYKLRDDITLDASLAKLGVKPDDVSAVVLSHLHLDHAGCATKLVDLALRDKPHDLSDVVPAFPKARYYVQRGEWDEATHPNPATKANYVQESFLPLERDGRLALLDGDCEPLPGIRVVVTGGHTDSHQAVIVESAGQGIAYLGDIAPIVASMRPAYNTAFDHHPLDTMRRKAEMLEMIIRNRWLIWFYHDTQVAAGRLKPGKDFPEIAKCVMAGVA